MGLSALDVVRYEPAEVGGARARLEPRSRCGSLKHSPDYAAAHAHLGATQVFLGRHLEGIERGAGTIINIASVVGLSPEALNGVYGASKAYVLALSHSLQHELADKGLRIQAVLPGATTTALWALAGLPYQDLPASIVMSPEDMVDAALVGLDRGELVTIPALHDGDEWTRFEAQRRALAKQFGNSVPAPRYRAGVPASSAA